VFLTLCRCLNFKILKSHLNFKITIKIKINQNKKINKKTKQKINKNSVILKLKV
jgi:hypothetical protein